MALYIIVPIHLNFPIRSKCVFKIIIHRKNSGLVSGYLRIKTSVIICVCCMMSCSEIILSQDGVIQRSMGCTKKKLFSSIMVTTSGKY